MSDIFNGTVAVIGLGYIGLPTAAALATRGVAGRRGRHQPGDRRRRSRGARRRSSNPTSRSR